MGYKLFQLFEVIGNTYSYMYSRTYFYKTKVREKFKVTSMYNNIEETFDILSEEMEVKSREERRLVCYYNKSNVCITHLLDNVYRVTLYTDVPYLPKREVSMLNKSYKKDMNIKHIAGIFKGVKSIGIRVYNKKSDTRQTTYEVLAEDYKNNISGHSNKYIVDKISNGYFLVKGVVF